MTNPLCAVPMQYREDAVLLPYQARWYADRSEVKIIEKSRRTGITWTSAAEHADEGASGLGDTWYIGYSEDQGEEFIRDVAEFGRRLHGVAVHFEEYVFEDFDPVTGHTDAIKAFRIDWASGKRTTALSSRPRNLRGKQGLVTIDEAAFHDDLRGLLKAAMAMLIWGARVEIISTHNGIDNEFAKLIEEVRAGKFNYSLHRVTLDDALADGLYRRICRVNGKPWTEKRERAWRDNLIRQHGDDADEELFCIPSKAGAAYFVRDVIEQRMELGRPVLRLTCDGPFALRSTEERAAHVAAWVETELAPHLRALPERYPHYVGQDFGRVADLSVVAVGTLTQELVRDVPFLVEMSNVPFEQQRQVMFAILGGVPNLTKAHLDAGGNGAQLAEECAGHFGHNVVEQVKIGESWHMTTWAALKTAIEEGKFLLPSDQHVRDDFMMVKRVNGIPKLPNAKVVKDAATGKSQRRHGDAAVACAMLINASKTHWRVDAIGTGQERAALSAFEDGRDQQHASRMDEFGGVGRLRSSSDLRGF